MISMYLPKLFIRRHCISFSFSITEFAGLPRMDRKVRMRYEMSPWKWLRMDSEVCKSSYFLSISVSILLNTFQKFQFENHSPAIEQMGYEFQTGSHDDHINFKWIEKPGFVGRAVGYACELSLGLLITWIRKEEAVTGIRRSLGTWHSHIGFLKFRILNNV